MDNLFKQTRLRISGFGKENVGESGSSKDRTIPPQKSVSFKVAEKKKGQNWFRRQFSRQMSQDYDSNNGEIEHSVAIAAAAFAITSLDESSTPAKKLPKEDPSSSAITIKGRREETDPGRVSKKSSESKVPVTAATDTKPPEKVLLPAPSFRKTSSVVDKQKTGSFKPESASPKPDKQKGSRPPPPPPPPPPLPRTATKREGSTRPGMAKTQADIWEEAQMAKIKESYERQKVTINSWEEGKKTKAKRRLENKERELESKRAKAMEKFRSQIRYIDQVAGGARAKAEENQRNEVLKAKEKANAYRRTGKFPKSCFCF